MSKGNQVRVLNSPAAVSSKTYCSLQKKRSLCGNIPHGKTGGSGSKSEDLPSRFFFEALEEEAEKSFLAPYSGTISAFAVKQRSLHFPQGVFEKARHQSRMWNIKNIKIKNEEEIYLLKN